MSVDETRSRAVAALAQAALSFLRRFPPFDRMEDDALQFMAERLVTGYYPKGTSILAPAGGVPEFLYIVQRGAVEVRPPGSGGTFAPAIAKLGPGECFSVGALLEKRSVGPQYLATEDTFCYQLAADEFRALLERSARLRYFATSYLSSLLRDSQRLVRMHAAAYAGEERAAHRSLRSLVQRAPISCTPDTPIGQALETMHRARVGSILVVSPAGTLEGILTRHDVLDRIALARRDLGEPVREVMTPAPTTLDAEATAYDAALLIAREGIRHVPVMDGDRVIGIVTERDLFALQRASMRTVRRTLEAAQDVSALEAAAADIRTLAKTMLDHGIGAEQLTYIISTLNDALAERVIALERPNHELAGIEWCWLAFGSEGRYEQTICTDQDNGLVFADSTTHPEKQRERLVPFAQAVNQTLDACGFPLCKGGIMASNPRWCLSLAEWQAAFERWVRNTDAQEVLMSVIFFDLRALCGVERLAVELRDHVNRLAAARPVFLRQLARFAVETRPPLSFLGAFADDDRRTPGTIDLKLSGARIFVDAARILALAAGVTDTNTGQRLRHAGGQLKLPPEEIASAVELFYFIQGLRLRTQLPAAGTTAFVAPNRVDPGKLNEVDKRMLKEAFRQAGKLQARLTLDYQL